MSIEKKAGANKNLLIDTLAQLVISEIIEVNAAGLFNMLIRVQSCNWVINIYNILIILKCKLYSEKLCLI